MRDDDVFDLTAAVANLHPAHDTFPGEVFMELATDGLDLAGVERNDPIPYEGFRETYLPECEFRGRENRRIRSAVLASASLRSGLEADLLDEVTWWRTDDFWRYGLYAALALIRARAERQSIPVDAFAQRLADGTN